jgi:glycerophosphoryl diester phosphodiesterase
MKTTVGLFLSLTLAAAVVAAPPIVIAHRGASGYLPEHTLPAKALAYGMGADFLEQDLVLTKDDVPVVLHDIQIDTVTDVASRFPDRKRADGRYYALDFTLAEIKQLRATERFSAKTGKAAFPNRFPTGQSSFTIPTLEEELQFIQGLNHSTGRGVGIYPEIKQPAWHRREGHDISRIVVPILQRHGYRTKEDACFLQCFEFAEVKRLRAELGWQGRLIQLLGGKDSEHLRTPAGLAELAKIADGIGPSIGSIITGKTPPQRQIANLVKLAHAAGLLVHPYTVRLDELPPSVGSVEELHRMLFEEAKVDGVFTDFPDATTRYLRP